MAASSNCSSYINSTGLIWDKISKGTNPIFKFGTFGLQVSLIPVALALDITDFLLNLPNASGLSCCTNRRK